MEGDKRYYILITDTTFSEQTLFSQLKWAMTINLDDMRKPSILDCSGMEGSN